MKKIIYKLIYNYYKRKDERAFKNQKLKNSKILTIGFFTINGDKSEIKFKNSLKYDSKYLPENKRKYLKLVKENINRICELIDVDVLDKIYYKGHEAIVQHVNLSPYKFTYIDIETGENKKFIIRKFEDYLERYSVYNDFMFDNIFYVYFTDEEINKSFLANYPIHISELKWVETESEWKTRIRQEKLNKLLCN